MDKDLGQDWRRKMARGAKYVVQCSHVKANAYHYDAKLLPHLHPYDQFIFFSATRPKTLSLHPHTFIKQTKSSVVCACTSGWYGTGSLLSETGSGSPAAHFRNRLCLIQSGFRTFSLYPAWKLDWIIKHDLFNINFRRKQQRPSRDSAQDTTDSYIQRYGTVVPKNIPERSLFFVLGPQGYETTRRSKSR